MALYNTPELNSTENQIKGSIGLQQHYYELQIRLSKLSQSKQ